MNCSNDLSRLILLLAAGVSRPAVSLLIPDLTGRRGRGKDVERSGSVGSFGKRV